VEIDVQDQSIELNLAHEGKDITGTGGPNAERQWPIPKGAAATR
jgi:hypothetical protein